MTTPEIVTTETKPGPRTTEFWVALGGIAANFLNIVGIWDFVPNRISDIIIGVIAGAYALSRGVAKIGQPYQAVVTPSRMRRRANR
jgi:hypothetical protein